LTGSQDPKEVAKSQYFIAVTHLNSGRETEAMEALRKTLADDPEHADAHYYVGVLLLRENRMEEALDHLDKHLGLSPQSPTAADARALLEALRQSPKAE
jgi:tetratricopeptide (TPR) repeat protein